MTRDLKLRFFTLTSLFALIGGVFPLLLNNIIEGNQELKIFNFLLVVIVFLLISIKHVSIAFSFLITLIVMQPFVSMTNPSGFGSFFIKFQVASKELFTLIFILSFLFIRKIRYVFTFVDFVYIGLLIFALINIPKGTSGLTVALISFKEILMYYLLFMVGRIIYVLKVDIQEVFNYIGLLAMIATIFGLIEYFFPYLVWNVILDPIEYVYFKTGSWPKLSLDGNYPNNFFTYIGSNNYPVRRMVSFNGEATSLSRFLGSFLVVLLIIRKHKSPILIALIVCGLILTNTRGGLLYPITFLAVYLYWRKGKIMLPLVILGLSVLLTKINLFDVSSANNARHTAGLINGFQNMLNNPIGRGMGSTGQVAASYTGDFVHNDTSYVAESFVGSLGAQLGLIGVVLFILFNLILLFKLFKRIKPGSSQSKFEAAAFCLLLVTFITSFLSNSAVSMMSCFISLIFTGYVIEQKRLHS